MGHTPANSINVLITLRGGRGGRTPLALVDAEAGEGDEPQEHPIVLFVAKMLDISQKDCKYNKMARELKDKDEAAKSNETYNHVFHNTGRETANQGFNNHYSLTNSGALQHPTFSHGYNQHPYIWQHPLFPVYQHFA